MTHCVRVASKAPGRLRPIQPMTVGPTANATSAPTRIAAWITVMTIAVRRIFQNGRVSSTPLIRFIASMIAENKLDASQSVTNNPIDKRPTLGFS